jgi:2-oxoglutarate dehydrogenase E1 component
MMTLSETLNMDYIDAQYAKWKADPKSVASDWQAFFKGFEMALRPGAAADRPDDPQALDQHKVEALIWRYRELGHLLACMDPLADCPIDHPLLSLESFGLQTEDLPREFSAPWLAPGGKTRLKEIIAALKETYCRSLGVEYMHLQDPAERQWLQERMEPVRNRPPISSAERKHILRKLVQAAMFEAFLNKKYAAVTRFSLEGGDVVIPMLDALVQHVAQQGCQEIILGMSHRGRLNVQTSILAKPYEAVFSEFESCYDPEQVTGAGDVKYHNGYLSDLALAQGQRLRIFLMNNPSHLEAVDPVVEGFTRARQDLLDDDRRHAVLPLLLHGDAAFAGQGIVAETLNMSQLDGYKTGGTIHIVINNQIGYTTLPHDARSTRYSTDVAKMLMVPILHVHGENPEAVVHAIKLAADYRRTFAKDVVLDVICYRRYGHNEGDEPYFTQPLMYDRIRQRPPVYEIYGAQLADEGLVDQETIATIKTEILAPIEQAYQEIHGSTCTYPEDRFYENWQAFHGRFTYDEIETAVSREQLLDLANRLNTVPKGFSPHSKVERVLEARRKAVTEGTGVDWANAESLAFGSLLVEGHGVRLSGQDSGRGTFSQRHAVLFDTQSGEAHVPLNQIVRGPDAFQVFNSHLAEASVLGFEYGYSTARPRVLTLWEAQFGDFVNNAQAVIDLFIASGQAKWQRLSGLVLLLPHGWEGLGPEHSSARLERFLQLCAEDNLQVCNLTTPAQYFHLLRRQVRAEYRKPLVIMTPKSLLRHPLAVSEVAELTAGSFQPVLDDTQPAKKPDRVLLCSGKIYYQLVQARAQQKNPKSVILRLEQFYPFPDGALQKVLGPYRTIKHWTWVQEEPENMGGWQFVKPRLEAVIGATLNYVGRKAAASPATGFPMIYRAQQAAISEQALGRLAGK